MAMIFQQGEKPQIKIIFDSVDNKLDLKTVVTTYTNEKQVSVMLKLAEEKLKAWKGVVE